MNNIWTIIWIGLVAVLVIALWRGGQFMRLATFVRETREEVLKCAWPTWNELKGSTAVVMVSIALLGIFTMACDGVFVLMMRLIASA
jgi:preprotein translocase subunit SecE